MARVHFLWSPQFTQYDLGPFHPLKPERLELTYSLISDYGLLTRPDVVVTDATPATEAEVLAVHAREYVAAVRALDEGGTPNPYAYGLGTGDNPIFPGIYEASLLYSGASLQAAQAVYRGEAAAAFNISGGLHHAHRARAAGFCVFNDPAIAIAWLLKESGGDAKVVYLDIDAHHGDGVQEAFYDDPRVLTISLHESGRTLFPGSGFVEELGAGEGTGFAVNLPLGPFTGDEVFLWAFEEIVPPLVAAFRPDFFVSQLGADGHFLDPQAHLHLSTAAYESVFVRIGELAGKRWIALGGGGYSLDAVPRVWTLAFAAMVGAKLADELPGREGYLRDQASPELSAAEIKSTRDFAARAVEQIKRQIFPYHRL